VRLKSRVQERLVEEHSCLVVDAFARLRVGEEAVLELCVSHFVQRNCRLAKTNNSFFAVGRIGPDCDSDLRFGPDLLQNRINELCTLCLLDECLREGELEVEFLVELGTALDHARLLSDATPLDLNPNLRVTCGRDCLNNVELGDVDHEVSHVCL